MVANSNLKTKLQLDYPFKIFLENNRNFYDFPLKSAHFLKYQLSGLSNCKF